MEAPTDIQKLVEQVRRLLAENSGPQPSAHSEYSHRVPGQAVFDVPEPKIVVTEHRAHGCTCSNCDTVTWASFPAEVTAPVQYDARICSFVVYLLNYHFLPEDRVAELVSDLLALAMVPATIARINATCSQRFRDFADAVRDRIAAARVKHLDETGFRIGGRTQWLNIFSTALLTFYRMASKRRNLPSGALASSCMTTGIRTIQSRRAARPVQCPPSARTQSPGGNRE